MTVAPVPATGQPYTSYRHPSAGRLTNYPAGFSAFSPAEFSAFSDDVKAAIKQGLPLNQPQQKPSLPIGVTTHAVGQKQANASSPANASPQSPEQNAISRRHQLLQYIGLGVGALGIIFYKQSLALLKSLPMALLNLPKTLRTARKTIMDAHFHKILPYKSAMTETPTTVLSPIDMRYKNMAFQDWASRFSILGVYIMQGILAIQHKRRPVETWIRNAGAWYLTVKIMMYTKDPESFYKWGINQLMAPQKTAKQLQNNTFLKGATRKMLDRWINPFRPKWNYLKLCETAGIKASVLGVKGNINHAAYNSAIWDTLDINELRLLELLKDRLKERARKTGNKLFLRRSREIEKFTAGIFKMKLVSTAFQAVGQTLLIGLLVPIVAIKLATPFDNYFERPKRRIFIDANNNKRGLS